MESVKKSRKSFWSKFLRWASFSEKDAKLPENTCSFKGCIIIYLLTLVLTLIPYLVTRSVGWIVFKLNAIDKNDYVISGLGLFVLLSFGIAPIFVGIFCTPPNGVSSIQFILTLQLGVTLATLAITLGAILIVGILTCVSKLVYYINKDKPCWISRTYDKLKEKYCKKINYED